MEIYAAMVDNLDRNVGRLLAEWQRTGRDRNAVIVFMSDNGAEQMAPEAAMLPGLADWIAKNFDNSLDNLGHAGSYVGYGSGWANVSNAPFRGFKGLAYEGGVRTAGIVVWPGVRAARVDDYVNVLDLPPTLLHLAGVAPPDGSYKGRPVLPMEGRSLVGNSGQFAAADPQRTSAHELFGHRGVVRGDLKAVSTWTGATGPGPWQLHDLSTDPGEQHDLAAVRAPELASLSAWFERWAKENGVIEPARNAPVYGKE
jgi:arylsulfatase